MTYPLRFPDDDPRFSNALIAEIATALAAHGYPTIGGSDTAFADLRAALAGFLYGPAFNRGDRVTWISNDKVWCGWVEYVTNTENGQVARIQTDPQPGDRYHFTNIVPCRELTLVQDGAK